jgi:hypothetical protein
MLGVQPVLGGMAHDALQAEATLGDDMGVTQNHQRAMQRHELALVERTPQPLVVVLRGKCTLYAYVCVGGGGGMAKVPRHLKTVDGLQEGTLAGRCGVARRQACTAVCIPPTIRSAAVLLY